MQRVLSFILLVVLVPLLLIAILLIVITTWAPAFFIQERIGRDKQPFKIYKLRTMKNGKITLIGKLFRKIGIDEIPQLLNIMKGEMNFVGPRPLTMSDIERLGWTDETYESRWHVNPGITGLAQLTNVCDKNVTWQNDKAYVENKSIALDFKIIVNSVLIPFIGKSNTKSIIHKSAT